MVSDVIGSSPANRAGLRTGDRIVSYDGNRVYSMWELKNMAFDGSPGEDVILDIEVMPLADLKPLLKMLVRIDSLVKSHPYLESRYGDNS